MRCSSLGRRSKKEIEEITDLPGIGPQTAEKLKAAGYTTIESIATASPAEIAMISGISEAQAAKFIAAARAALDLGEVETAYEFLQRRKQVRKITTGCKALDDMLDGGIETGTITEVYGPYGSGKTQLCHQLSVTVQLPEERGGLGKGAFYIDTEHTFRPERIVQIAKAFELDPMEALKNILYARAFNTDHQVLITDKAEEYIKSRNIGLLIVDSLISHFRGEYVGRETLAERQQRLNKYIHKLLRMASVYNIGVLVTNQVLANPGIYYGDPLSPAGGHVLGHGVTCRLYIRRTKGDRRVIKLVKSPYLPESSIEVAITESGIAAVE
ncbi:MAG: DNA repair and recombination protein RadA [Thermoproteota archaeon]|nr:MAG: DNA repair and recombination protein RadA [Candidatus Korarchaeota archaeon]